MKHVLMIPSWYGTEEQPVVGSFFREHALALSEAGIRVGVVYPEIRQLRRLSPGLLLRNHFQSSAQMEGPLPTCRLHGWNLYPKLMKRQMEAWCRFAEKLAKSYFDTFGKPDMIHAQSSVWAGIASKRISEKTGIPYCITEHASVFMKQAVLGTPWQQCWSTPFIRDAFDQAKKIVAVSSALRKALEPYTSKEIEVIPNVVDTRLFQPKKALKRHYFHFLTVSYLVPRKRVDLLLRAFKKVGGHLTIGGDGPEKPRLIQLVKELGIENSVSFLGALSREGVRDAFQKADAFVLASEHETFGVVCIEALASGVPVVATNSGGTADIVNEQTGYLVPANDENALVQAMERIKTHPFSSENLHRVAVDHYGSEAISHRYIKLFSEK